MATESEAWFLRHRRELWIANVGGYGIDQNQPLPIPATSFPSKELAQAFLRHVPNGDDFEVVSMPLMPVEK